MYATIIKFNTLHNVSDGSTVINRRSWRKTRLKVSNVHSSLLNSTKEATGQKIGDEVTTNMSMEDEGPEGHEHKVGEMRIMKRHENIQKPDGDEFGRHTTKGSPEAGEDKISTSTATTITPSPTPSTLSEFLKHGSNHSSTDPTLYSDKSSADTPLYSEFRDSVDSSPAKANLIVMVCAAVVGVVVIFAVIFFALRYWKQSQEQGIEEEEEEEEAKKRHMSAMPVLANRTSHFPRSNSSDTESGIRQSVWKETRGNEQTGGSFAERMSVRISKRFNSRISIFSTSGDIESQSQIPPGPQAQAPQPYDWSQLAALNTSHMGVHPGTLVSVPITSPPLDNSFDSNFGYLETTRSTPELNDKHTTWPERRRGDGPDGITIPPPGSSSPYSSTYSSPYSSRPGTPTPNPSASRPLTPIQKPKFKSSSSPKSSSKGKGKAKFSPSPSNLSPSKPSKLRNDTKATPASPVQASILEQDVFDSLPYRYDPVSPISPCDEAVTPVMKAAYDDTASVYSVASSVASVNSYLMPGLSPAPSQSSLIKTPKSSKIPVAASKAVSNPASFVITPPTPPTPFLSLASMPNTPSTPEISFPPLTPLPTVPSALPKLSTSTPPSPALAPLKTSLPSFSKSPMASVSSTSLPPLIPPSEFPPSPTSPPPSTELPALPTGLPGLSAVKGLKDKGRGPEI